MDRIKYFLELCIANAHQSTCLRRRFGAVIGDSIRRRPWGQGYNGAPRDKEECTLRQWCMREELNVPSGERYELCCSVHAEQNALLQAGTKAEGMDMYLYGEDAKTGIPITAPVPCFLCCKLIINADVEHVYSWSGKQFIEIDIPNLYEKYMQEAFQKN